MESKQGKQSDHRISSVELQHWRGATCSHRIDFDPSKQVVLIYGENGTGKSTILDGIEYALSGKLGSLEFLSLDYETKKEKYLCTLGKRQRDALARVTIGQSRFEARIGSYLPDPSAPRTFSIRRASLKQITEAKPQDRYSLIAPCFEVDSVRRCEEELASTVKEYERRSAEANTRTSTSLQELRNQHQLTKPQGVVTNDIVLAWAVETAGRDLSNDTGKKQLLDKLLRSAPTFFVRANDVVTASSALDQARLSQQALQTTGEAGGPSKRDQDLERVLDTGKSFILEYRPEQCPVCEREDQVNPRIARLNERLIGLSTSKLLNEERTTAAARVRSAETQLATTVQNLQAAVTALVPDLRAVSDELLEPVRNLQGIESFDAGSLAGLKSLAEQKDAHNDRIKLQRDRVAGRISRIESLGVTLNTYNDNKDLSALYDETTKRLKTTLGVIQEMRKSFIQSELNAISGEVSSMYSSLHPSEPYAPGAMELVEGRKGSLVHKAKLGEIETIPNATFSESHIDTLALCVHLALAKRIGGRDCILLLDDVYHSVDNQHLDRMIDLLMDQSKHFQQVIMATHLLRAARRFAMNRVGKGDVDHIVLVSKWSLERGLQWRNQPLESEVLESLINNLPFDRQSVAGKTGVLMEAVLDALVCNYRCKVPKSNDGENTLSELRDGFSKTAKSFKRQTGNFTEGLWSTSGDDVALIDSWKAFDECFGVRNDVGAHWKEVGQDIPDETVEFFARSALQVINVVTCPHCRSLPRKKEGSYWTCMCKRSRFTPLESS